MLKKLHFWTGIVFVIIFLLSGIYMARGFPDLYNGNPLIRMMYRANHIYLLMAAIVNLIFGSFINQPFENQAKIMQKIAAILVILSPFLLLTAFIYEPQRLLFDRLFTFSGILSLFAGVLLYMFCNRIDKKIE